MPQNINLAFGGQFELKEPHTETAVRSGARPLASKWRSPSNSASKSAIVSDYFSFFVNPWDPLAAAIICDSTVYVKSICTYL